MADQVIIIDWGTSNFRAWLIHQASGEVLDEISDGLGMASLLPSSFCSYCADRVRAWRDNSMPPVYMAGMVGAAQGWAAAPQLPLPLKSVDLAHRVVAAPGMENAWIVPGAQVVGDADRGIEPDVMRGEEVQIFGAMELSGLHSGVLCLPGTHCKWARMIDGTLVHFTTSMTGEAFTLFMNYSILGRGLREKGMPDPLNIDAFVRGLGQAASPGGLLHQLFTTRARLLAQELSEDEVADYLSGVLIGSEIAAMSVIYPARPTEKLLLVCNELLRKPYEFALRQADYEPHWIPARNASLQGIQEIIRQHGDRDVA